jgi:hypothetical protein
LKDYPEVAENIEQMIREKVMLLPPKKESDGEAEPLDE